MRTLVIPVLLLLNCLLLVVNCEVVQTVIVSRHCDRTPISSSVIPVDPVNWKRKLGLSPGQLTGLGISQCSTMGSFLRERYLNPQSEFYISGITNYFDSDLFKFRATSVDRTIISLNSVAFGLFPNHTGLINDITHTESLIDGVTVIPIHTVESANDILLRGYDKCPAINDKKTALVNSAEYRTLTSKYRPVLENVSNWTNLPVPGLDEVYFTYDLLNVQRSHNLLNIQPVLDNWKEIEDVGYFTQYLFFNRAIQDRLGGGPFVNEVYETFKSTVNGKKGYKYIHYSAHDTTLQSVLATLDLSNTYPELQEIPPYGAQIIFELHNTSNVYSVQVVVRRGFDAPFTSYKLPAYCASEDCQWNDFIKYINTHSRLTTAQWCNSCRNDYSGECVHLRVHKEKATNTILLVAVPVAFGLNLITLALLFILCARKTTLGAIFRTSERGGAYGEINS